MPVLSGVEDVERNIGFVRRMEDAFNRRDYASLRQVLSDDFGGHNPGGREASIDDLEINNEHWHLALPGKRTEIVDAFGEGDRVVVRIRDRGVNTGGVPWFDIPANGREMDIGWVEITRHDQTGRIVEMWALADVPTLLEQLGAEIAREQT